MDTKKKRIQDTIAELLEEADTKQESKKNRAYMKALGVAVLKKLNDVTASVKANKLTFPSVISTKVLNLKDFPRPVINIPDEVSLKQVSWLKEAFGGLTDEIKKLASKGFDWPKGAKNAIPVRLSDGEEFYKAVADVVVQGGSSGGGGGTPKLRVTVDGQKIEAVPVVNPDGSNIGGGEGGGGDASAANQDEQTALLTTIEGNQLPDGHNVTVNNASIPVTGTFWQATQPVSGTVTANLSAVDNAVLDTIDAVLDTIKVDTEAIETAVEAIQSGQLADGHNVTVDNASGASAVNIQDGGNTITVDGTVAVTHAALTELGSAINSDKVDVNIVSSDVATGGTSAADDDDFTDGTTPGTPVMGVYEATPTTVTDGDLGVAGITEARRLKTSATIDAALPAGTNAIGKLAANSGVDIGDVDVTSVIPGTGATNLGKAGNSGSSSTHTGVAAFGLRHDTPNDALADTDYDYTFLSLYRTGALRTAIPEEDFAALGSNHVKKYYTNSGAVTDGIVWSPAAGKRWYVTDIFINVSAAATVTLEDDLDAGDSAVWKAELAANGGWSHHFGTPLFSGEDAADLLVTTSAGNVYITVTGYEI